MSGETDPRLEQIKALIKNGKIDLKGLYSSKEDLETEEVKCFLNVCADILKLSDNIKSGEIDLNKSLNSSQADALKDFDISKMLLDKLENGIKLRFNASNSKVSSSGDRVSLQSGTFKKFYVDTQTNQLVPASQYRILTHEMFHVVFDDIEIDEPDGLRNSDWAPDPVVGLARENLCVKLTDNIMQQYDDIPRRVYSTGLQLGKHNLPKETKDAFNDATKQENKQQLYSPYWYRDFAVHKPVPELRPSDLSSMYSRMYIHENQEIVKEELNTVQNIEAVICPEKSISSLITKAYGLDITFTGNKLNHEFGKVSQQEFDLIKDKAKELGVEDDIELSFKRGRVKISDVDCPKIPKGP